MVHDLNPVSMCLQRFPNTLSPQILLYESIALVIAAGLWATVSLLLRHWKPIEAHASKQVRGAGRCTVNQFSTNPEQSNCSPSD